MATRKIDGTCCLIRDGKVYKRRELRQMDVAPPDFEEVDTDELTMKRIGWVPVGDGPDDRWYRDAMAAGIDGYEGTYELVGPKVQGNPEGFGEHRFVRHGSMFEPDVPRTFDGLRDYLDGRDIEGIVFHHHDGRMAKIKGRDFGFKRP